ncbi:hypothetical protein BCY80_20310 [Yersinia pestis]|nr:hypothetical protein BCY80_20310 [Yersinia pestis]
MRQVTKSKKIKILPYPEWLVKAGMSKGIDHDRQHLGIILAAGEMIKVRQVNAEYKEKLKLYLLNDNKNTQRSISFNTDWIELSVDAISVPFINTPYSDGLFLRLFLSIRILLNYCQFMKKERMRASSLKVGINRMPSLAW